VKNPRRIVIDPNVRELLSDCVRITSIEVKGTYLSALRPKEGGSLRVLRSITERSKHEKGDGKTSRDAVVNAVRLADYVLEIYDATVAVAGKPQRLRPDRRVVPSRTRRSLQNAEDVKGDDHDDGDAQQPETKTFHLTLS